MKIVYYDPETKEIAMLAHNVIASEQLPYIEIAEEQFQWIKSCNMHTNFFFVDEGILKKKPQKAPLPIIKPIVNYCYNIPLTSHGPVDILCQQYSSKKELHIILQNDNNIDISKITNAILLVACKNNDANYPLWYFTIPPNTLSSEPIVYCYSGEDDFRLYTYKIFDSYLHEQNS